VPWAVPWALAAETSAMVMHVTTQIFISSPS
jgi:hypothetical protein